MEACRTEVSKMNLRDPILLALLAVAGVSAVPGSIIRPRTAFAQAQPYVAQDEATIERATCSRYTDFFAPDLSGIGSKVHYNNATRPKAMTKYYL